jgi:hypothetical protein
MKFLAWLIGILASTDGAIMYGQVLGYLRKKLGGNVFSKAKGDIHTVRARVFPTQRGTLKEYAAYVRTPYTAFSFKQMNTRNVNRFLGAVVRQNLATLIDVVWNDFNIRHHVKKLSGGNQFVKVNKSPLYNSISNKGAVWAEPGNCIDLTKMLVSHGDLEPTSGFTSAAYSAGTLTLTFVETFFTNGLATDVAYCVVVNKKNGKILSTSWTNDTYLYGPTSVGTRGTPTTMTLPTGLTKANLVAYIFFKDVAGTIGYSDSVAVQVT